MDGKKVIDYKLAYAEDPKEVNNLLQDGWQLWGSPVQKESGYLVQPMVKYAD